jgi:hypothetical protein
VYHYPFITDPSIAEAVATWKATVFCCDQGFQSVILEGDALEIVQAFRQEGPSWSKYGQIIANSRTRLNSIQSWEPSHIRREANEAAHLLAKAALHQSLDGLWQGCVQFYSEHCTIS